MTDSKQAIQAREYRKTATIMAEQYLGQHVPGVCTGGRACQSKGAPDDSVPHIHTLEGDLTVSHGDWIATGVKGEHWAIKPDVFAASYEPVSVLSALSGGEAAKLLAYEHAHETAVELGFLSLTEALEALSALSGGGGDELGPNDPWCGAINPEGYRTQPVGVREVLARLIADRHVMGLMDPVAYATADAIIALLTSPPITGDLEEVQKEYYKRGWNDRESDILERAERIFPPTRGDAEAKLGLAVEFLQRLADPDRYRIVGGPIGPLWTAGIAQAGDWIRQDILKFLGALQADKPPHGGGG